MVWPIGKWWTCFAKEAIRTQACEEGFFDGQTIGIEKTNEKLAEDVCRCENHGFKHGWVRALWDVGVDSASPLYKEYKFPFKAFDAEKTNDEEEGIEPETA